MINLLPNEEKNEIQAARTNTVLINFIMLLSMTIVFLSISCFAAYSLITSMKSSAENTIRNNASALIAAGNQTGDIGTTIATAETILVREISYSNIIAEIGSKLPYGVVLDKLELNESISNGPLKLEFRAKSTSVTPELISNLGTSQLFSSIETQAPISSAGNSPDYPILINCSLTIKQGAEA